MGHVGFLVRFVTVQTAVTSGGTPGNVPDYTGNGLNMQSGNPLSGP